ncbi:MAG: hypothetical protein EOO01_32685 [Chitinophagaceae bacterium]|nr:MAG: hypothetical protein EOO01_32685 [Chitinophagaceae bacterium]
MAFINLKLIEELESEAEQQHMIAETQSYGWERERLLDSITYMGLMKSHFQAKNLVQQLKRLHELCTDFAAGNFEKKLEEFQQYAEEGEVFDPVDDIRYFFTDSNVYVLPPKIEQYAELMATVNSYARIKAVKREGFEKFFGGKVGMGYLGSDIDGATVIVPASEMPEDVLNSIEANREIKEIEVEYCLDKYNDFYHACTCLIEVHACSAEYKTEQESAQGLAKEILGYFN